MATGPDSSGTPNGDGRPLPSRVIPRGSDRVLGLICLAIAVWYVTETSNFQITQFGSGPVGPKTLPTLVGIIFGLFALYLVLRPDPSPTWPTLNVAWQLVVIVAVSFLFGQLLEPLGFIVSSTLMAILIGAFFAGPMQKLVPLSFGFAVVLAFIFNNWLELRLPTGLWGGF